MNYREIQPPEILSSYVKCFWILESNEKPGVLTKERILPDGNIELIFHYGDVFKQYRQNHTEIQPRSFVYGQITQFIEIGPTGKTGIIAVRFYPSGSEPFLQIPISQLSDQAVCISAIFGKEGRELEGKIMTAIDNRQRIEMLQNFLISRMKQYHHYDYIIAECVKRIVRLKGQITVESLSNTFNISTRHLERKFNSTVGMSPKLLSRIVRFQNIFKLFQNKQINNLTALAYESGYYDQAHFIRDFKQFSGINPKIYFSQEHPLSDYFTSGV